MKKKFDGDHPCMEHCHDMKHPHGKKWKKRYYGSGNSGGSFVWFLGLIGAASNYFRSRSGWFLESFCMASFPNLQIAGVS